MCYGEVDPKIIAREAEARLPCLRAFERGPVRVEPVPTRDETETGGLLARIRVWLTPGTRKVANG